MPLVTDLPPSPFKHRAFTQGEIAYGWALEYPLSWRDLVVHHHLFTPEQVKTLDTLSELIENECAVTIIDGKHSIADWDPAKRFQEIEPWLKEALDQDLIDKREHLKLRLRLMQACM
jgi:hypothetical protein